MTQGKRGISALEIQSELEMKSYGTAWNMLHKIRESFRQRDETYKISNIIELDGGVFGRRQTGNQTEVLVASETKIEAQNFVDNSIDKNATLYTDNSPSFAY